LCYCKNIVKKLYVIIMSQLAQQFQKAVNALQQKDFIQAEKIASQLNQQAPNHPDILHLLALATKQRQPDKAADYFTRSLKANPKQPSVLSNYANFLQGSQQLMAAKQNYTKALQINPKLPDAWYNLASLHYQSRDYLAAIEAANRTLQQKPDFKNAVILKARSELDYKLFDKAEETLEKALLQWPQEPSLLFNLALVYRYTERTKSAREILEQLGGKFDEAQRQFQLGCLAYDDNAFEQAEQLLLKTIELKNDFVPAHEAINKLYWEHDLQDKFLASFRESLKTQPDSLPLAYAYLAHLLRSQQFEQADSELEMFLNRFGDVHSLLHMKGTQCLRKGNIEEASVLFDKVLEQQPRHPRYLIDKANVLLRQKAYDKAFQLLDRAHENQPLNQEIHAYKGLCMKLSGREQEEKYLNNYDDYVKVGYLPAPHGYDSLEEFWPILVKRVQALHKTQHQPLDQSVCKGTQTVGSLLSMDDPVIQAYKQSLERFINDYLSELPDDKKHPVTSRYNSGYHFSGSWSVKLFKQGFHTNHVHPEGWLSMCTYLSIPAQVKEGDPEHKGWIKFGQTSLNLGEQDTIDTSVCPKPGMCIIFPSYCWHGTEPFDSDEERITIPCDIFPS